MINGSNYTVDMLSKLPQDLHGENIKTCSTTDNISYGFFGSMHPFSNFHQTKFKFQGYEYHSAEQMIQHLKAVYFDDQDTASKIMKTKTALECKKLLKNILNYNQESWNPIAKSMCEEGIKAEFVQQPVLQEKLLKTRQLTLVESCYDQHWGTGIPLENQQALNQHMWTNQGIQGQILEKIREELWSSRTETPLEDTNLEDKASAQAHNVEDEVARMDTTTPS